MSTDHSQYTSDQRERMASFMRSSMGFNDLVIETLDQNFGGQCFNELGVDQHSAVVDLAINAALN